jgi:hypothetical protein
MMTNERMTNDSHSAIRHWTFVIRHLAGRLPLAYGRARSLAGQAPPQTSRT